MTRLTAAKLYMLLIIGLGVAVCAYAVHSLPTGRLDLRFALLAALTLGLSSRITVKIPRFKSDLSVADTLLFLSLLLYGGQATVLLAAAEGLATSLRICKKPFTILFNAAEMACATVVTWITLNFVFGSVPEVTSSGSLSSMISLICLLGLTQFLANSWIIGIAAAWRTGQPLWQTWSKHYLWSSISYFAGAVTAGLTVKLIGQVGFEGILVTVPVIALVYFSYQMYLKNVASAAAQAEQAERHVEELSHYIAERARAEEALRQSEAKYRLLIENIPDAVWSVNEAGENLFVSSNIETICGLTPEEFTQTRGYWWTEHVHPDDRDKVATAYEALFRRTKMLDIEYRIRRRDGVWIWIHDKATSTYEKDGLIFADGLLSDVTERRLLEAQLRQAQKLESIGQLAGGIAHEINTPLQYVSDNTRFLRDSFNDVSALLNQHTSLIEACRAGNLSTQLVDEMEAGAEDADLEYLVAEAPKAIQEALDGIEQVSKIVKSMKEFASPSSAIKSAADLNQAIENTITVASSEWKPVAEVITEFDAELPPVLCLLGEFNQVILNLLINAMHAIADVVGDGHSGKGRITVSTRREGDWAVVRVADTGTGIPEAVREKVFDPFFTTKPVGTGTGQGLAISHTVVVEKHGGQISFESEVGQGTTFIVKIPLNPSAHTVEREESYRSPKND